MPSRSLFDEFDAATAVRHGLPADAYTRDDFFCYEQSRIFSRHWILAGFAHALARAGDVMPVEVAGMPLLLLRDRENRIAAFHNVCRHRNLRLIEEAGNCGSLIRCPYHSWSYDLSGALRNAPCFGGGMHELPANFELADFGLVPVECAVWHDWIFVNLAAEPMPFDDFLAPLKRQLGAIDVADYAPAATIEFGEVRCNWKLLLENFIEPYHVQFVHRATTAQPLADHRTLIDEHCLGSAVDLSDEQAASARTGTLGVTSRYLTLFPTFVLGAYRPDQLGVYLHRPLAPDRTAQTRVIYLRRGSMQDAKRRRALERLWRSVHLEDHAMCLRLQQGRASPQAADGGVLSPCWETSVRRFQELVANSIRPALVDAEK